MPRRSFLKSAAASLAGGAVLSRVRGAALPARSELSGQAPLVISTWPFGKPANEAGLAAFRRTGDGLDLIEHGIRFAESDPENRSVGLAGIPNAAGVVQLDACIMRGPGHGGGSVAALAGFRHPISVARAVMERTRHVLLVGEGAAKFAAEHGFERGPKITAREKAAWRKWKAEQAARAKAERAALKASAHDHDTIAMVALLPNGDVFGGCSTSGLGYKLPGRVGDSPILGSGLYVDNEVGGAGATGIGENVMRYCGSFLVVEFMRQGLHPQDACIETIKRIARLDPRGFDLSINFIALDKQGRFGAAGTGQGFQYAVTGDAFSKVLQSPGLTGTDVGPVGGNQPKP